MSDIEILTYSLQEVLNSEHDKQGYWEIFDGQEFWCNFDHKKSVFRFYPTEKEIVLINLYEVVKDDFDYFDIAEAIVNRLLPFKNRK